ncbi:VOC family protein [Chitinophaga nivalis]|uniref:VOC family protein n=1 Tax=Chitinophaga nivalis TaxID=2991709 RepID=A0ABT3IT72_9BACT|nr:VOC family protein [Chitinophaga nivalis]MCW3463133.1 VOC family protein [Chitinophaga nivalis]MCW3487177.1 VOC family protein [Chitinophaga nivalis]
MPKPKTGTIIWTDLTVTDATRISEFYKSVVGWEKVPLSMGAYNDYSMNEPADGQTIAGICHARGNNNYLPPQWLPYIIVDNLDVSIEKCVALGGKVLGEKRAWEDMHYCLIQDPAGAYVMICG